MPEIIICIRGNIIADLFRRRFREFGNDVKTEAIVALVAQELGIATSYVWPHALAQLYPGTVRR